MEKVKNTMGPGFYIAGQGIRKTVKVVESDGDKEAYINVKYRWPPTSVSGGSYRRMHLRRKHQLETVRNQISPPAYRWSVANAGARLPGTYPR
jgi:hypothetical protein